MQQIIKNILIVCFLLVAPMLHAQHLSKLSSNRSGLNDNAVVDLIEANRFHTYVNSLSEIAALNVPDDWEITIVPTGEKYVSQANEVEYFVTDEENVITLASGNYAVIDLSNKRQFSDKIEFQRLIHFCNIQDGETVRINTTDFEINYFHRNYDALLQSADDRVIDGFFVDTVTYKVPNINHFVQSTEVFNNTVAYPNGTYSPFIWLNGNAGKIPQNEAIAPDGTYTAERLFGFNSTASNQLQIFGDTSGIDIGDTLTFSMYYKGVETTGGVEGIYSGASFGTSFSGSPNLAFNLDGNWHRGSITFVTTTIPTSKSLFFGVFNNFANGDTLNVWGFQLEKGSKATPLQRSSYLFGEKSYIYLYRKDLIKGEVLDLSNNITGRKFVSTASAVDTFANDQPYIQDALNYCGVSGRCNTVILPKNTFVVKYPLNIPRGVTLKGAGKDPYRTFGANQPTEDVHTIIKFNLVDKTKYGIYIQPTAPATILDNSGLENLYLEAIDTMAGFIYTEEISSCEFRNITTAVQTGSGLTGAITDIGLSINVAVSSDNHYNTFHDVVVGCGTCPVGLYYEGGIGNKFENVAFQGDTAVIVEAGKFHADRLSVEAANTGVFVKGGEVDINQLYTEDSAFDGGSTIRVEGTGNLNISNSTLQVADPLTDTLFNFISGGSISIRNTEIGNEGKFYISDDFRNIKFDVVGSVTELYGYLNLTDRLKEIVDIDGSHPTFSNSNVIFKRSFGHRKITDGQFTETTVINSTVSDTLWTAGSILLGGEENLTNLSDSIPSGTNANTVVESNYTTSVFGVANADLIRVTGSGGSEFIQNKTAPTTFVVGEIYTVSVWLKNLNVDGSASSTFAVRVGGVNAELSILARDTSWRRYERSIECRDATTTVTIRINNLTAGDSIAVAGLQINTGYHAQTYVPTVATGVLKGGNPGFTILSGDSLDISGIIKMDNDLITTGDVFHNHSHAELYNDKVSSIVQTVVANTPEQLLTLANGYINDFTESGDTLYYVGAHTKRFKVNCSFSWSNNTATTVNYLYIYLNDIEVNKFYAEQANVNANDIHAAATSGILELDPDDEITIYIESDTNSDVEIKHINLSLTEL